MRKLLIVATSAVFYFQLGVLPTAYAEIYKGAEIPICATKQTAQKIQNIYQKVAGAPLAVVGRMSNEEEIYVATGLAKENRRIIKASPKAVKKIWKSIDGWGKNTQVRLIFTMGGLHVLDFPSTVPIAQTDLDDGWIDIFSDQGLGVRGHLWLDKIHSIVAINIPGKDKIRTRAISFYGADGKLILGLYASITKKKFDQNAVNGFIKTWNAMSSMSLLCD